MTPTQEDFLELQFELLQNCGLEPDERKRYLKKLAENPPPEPNDPPITERTSSGGLQVRVSHLKFLARNVLPCFFLPARSVLGPTRNRIIGNQPIVSGMREIMAASLHLARRSLHSRNRPQRNRAYSEWRKAV